MKNVLIALGIVVLLGGCAMTKQAIEDYKTGKNTPLAEGEIAPKDQAAPIANAVSSLPIPFAAAAGPIVLFLGTAFFSLQRGANIRKNNNIVTPVVVAHTNAVTSIIQTAANIFTGIFAMASTDNPSTTGSVLQRIWKVALSTIAGGGSLALANPSLMAFLTGHPVLDSIFVFATSGIAGLEKGLSSVPPVVAATPTTVSAS